MRSQSAMIATLLPSMGWPCLLEPLEDGRCFISLQYCLTYLSFTHSQLITPSETTITMDQHANTDNPRRISRYLAAKVLQMCLDNGIALGERRPRPHSVSALNTVRSQLLQDPFFDPTHQPEELEFRLRMNGILFFEVIVLMSRLLRVLARQAPLTAEETTERIKIRTECLSQPFFDRRLVNSTRPFADEEFDGDEGCFV